MKVQSLKKKLLIPLLLIGTTATEAGLSSPALSVPPVLAYCQPCQKPPGCIPLPPQAQSTGSIVSVVVPGSPVLTPTTLQADCPLIPANSQPSTTPSTR